MADNIVVMNQGKNPLVSYNFMLRVEGIFDIPCKAVHSFKKENEYEYIQEGGLNDYVHMRRKPISQPFTLTVERYVGTDYYDPLYNGAELVLPLILLVSRYNNEFGLTKRSYVFTGCTVMSKEYGELNGEKSGLHTETIVIGYREMLVVTNPADFPKGNWMDDRNDDTSRKSTKNEFATPYTDNNTEDDNKYLNKGNWMDDRKDDTSRKSINNKFAKPYTDNNTEDDNKYLNKGNWIDNVKTGKINKETKEIESYAEHYNDVDKDDNNKYLNKGNWMDDRKDDTSRKSTKNKYVKPYEHKEDTDYIKKVMNKGNWMDDRDQKDAGTAVKYATRNARDDERHRKGNWMDSKRGYATHYNDKKADDNSKYLNKGNWMDDRDQNDAGTSVKYATRNAKDGERHHKGNWIDDKQEYATHYNDNKADDDSKYLNKGNWMSDRDQNDAGTAVKYATRNVKDDERHRKGNWMDDREQNDAGTAVKYATRSTRDFEKPEHRKWPTVSSARKRESGENK